MSDSDSDDDDIFTLQAFGPAKRKRNETKKVTKGFSLLDDALNHAAARQETDDKIALLEKEQPQQDALLAQVEETIAQSQAPQPTNAAQPKRDSALLMGMAEDLENVLGEERCQQWGKARDEDLSTKLGARAVLHFQPNKNNTEYFNTATSKTNTTSSQYYIKQLKDTLRKLVSPKNKTLQTAWIQPLRQSTRNATHFKYLLEQCLLCKLRQQYDLKEVPPEILLWLLRVACSSGEATISYGATCTLKGLLRQSKSMGLVVEGDEIQSTTQKAVFSLTTLASQLQCWVQLQLDSATGKNVKDDNQKEGSNKKDDSNKKEVDESTRANARGLESFLSIWNTAFESDQVSVTGGAEGAKTCLVMLAKMSLDHCFHSTEINHRLIKHWQCLVCSILQMVDQNIIPTESKQMAWIKETTAAIIKELKDSNLGPGEVDAEDSDDDNAWLCFALLCRIWPYLRRTQKHKTDCQFQKLAAQFHAMFCLDTLQHFFLLGDADQEQEQQPNWEEQIYTSLANYQRDNKLNYDLVPSAKSSLRWRLLCCALVALLKVNALRRGLEDDKPKCLAIVEVALGRCLDVGLELFKDVPEEEATKENGTPVKRVNTNNEYKSVESARNVARLLGLIKLQCTYLISRTNAMSSHFRRVSYLVQCQIKYLLDAQERAAFLGGDRKIVQQGIEAWLKKDQNSPTKSECQSDDDDNDDEDDMESPRKKQRTVLSENQPL